MARRDSHGTRRLLEVLPGKLIRHPRAPEERVRSMHRSLRRFLVVHFGPDR